MGLFFLPGQPIQNLPWANTSFCSQNYRKPSKQCWLHNLWSHHAQNENERLLFKNYYAFQDGASRILNQLWNPSRRRACVTAQVYVHDASPTFKRRRVVKILSSNHSPPQDFLSKLFCSSLSLLVIIILSHRVIMEYK